MDRETTQQRLKESIVFLCRTFIGVVSDFEVDGIICVSCDDGIDEQNVVFKIHELVYRQEEGDNDYEKAGIKAEDRLDSTCSKTSKQSGSRKRKLSNSSRLKISGNAQSDDEINSLPVLPKVKLELPFDESLDSENNQLSCKSSNGVAPIPQYSCYGCQFSCFLMKILDRHVLSVHGQSTYSLCQVCCIAFADVNDFDEHNQTSHGNDKGAGALLMCSSDAKRLISSAAMFPISKNHQPARSCRSVVSNFSSGDASCLLSAPTYPLESLSSQEKHDDVLDQNALRRCSLCIAEFPNFPAFNGHCETVHGMFACPYCIRTFSQRFDRDNHLYKHTGEKPFECSDCALSFSRLDSLRRHRTKIHSTLLTGPELTPLPGNCIDDVSKEKEYPGDRNSAEDQLVGLNYPYNCWVDGSFDPSDQFFDMTVQSFSGSCQSSDAIEMSDEEYAGRSTRRRYRSSRILDLDRTFICEVCRETVWGVVGFRDHCDMMHRRVPCPYCGVTFTQKASMERHQRAHTGERPFKCQFCDHTYTRKENLQTHIIRLHPPLT